MDQIPTELDFTEHWTNSIDKEVLRGIKVRDEKLKTHQSDSLYQYDVVGFDYTQPSCSKSHGSQLNRKLSSKNNRNTHRSVSPHKIKKKHKKIKKYKRKERTTCGMRIAELAQPSKRRCIETWRGKWDTLPTLMVDRLRQIVMDQKPIIPIKDAIICFKQKQTNNTKSRIVTSKKYKEIKMLCAIFGFRMSTRLAQPRNITLGSQLIPISRVVSDDITRLLKKRQTRKYEKNIQMEITNKITNWIADILEQSTYNLTLEDYIELEKEEGHIWDIIDELVDNSVLLCKDPSISSSDVIDEESDLKPSSDDLTDENEESDGSVDFENIISDIIEKTITSNDIQTQDTDISQEYLNDRKEYDSETSSESNETYFKNFLSNYVNEIENTLNDEESFEDANHFNDYDSELINKSVPNDEIQHIIPNSTDENKDKGIVELNNGININNTLNEHTDNIENVFNNDFLKTEAVEKINSLENSRNEALEDSNRSENNRNEELKDSNSLEITSIDKMKHHFTLENIPREVSISLSDGEVIKPISQDKDEIEIIIQNKTENIDNVIEEKNMEIDETIPLTDITSEDSFKKVKFSNMDSKQGQLKSKSNFRVWENKKSGTQSIHFAPPNKNLLITGDADESWPEHLTLPLVKSSVSISKSVLSLGKLNESEENYTDHISENQNNLKWDNIEIDGERVENSIEKNMSLQINSSNEQIIVEKLTNNDPCSTIEDAIDTNNMETYIKAPKILDKDILNKNRNDEHVVDDDLTNNDLRHVIGDVTDNIELDSEELQRYIDKNINRNSNNVIDKYHTNIESGSVIENIKKNSEEISMEMQKITDKVSLIIKRNNEHVINSLTNKRIAKASQASGSNNLKHKTNETSNIINKKRSVNLSVELLPLIFIYPEKNKQSILHEKALQNATKRVTLDENCQFKECEVRIWCQGLQNVLQHLDLWMDWINNTCSNLTYLKQREKFPPCNKRIQKYNNHKWIKLKTNIDADAKLWENLSTSLQLGLRSYKYFHIPKTKETYLMLWFHEHLGHICC